VNLSKGGKWILCLLGAVSCLGILSVSSWTQSAVSMRGGRPPSREQDQPLTTEERLRLPGWWPTQTRQGRDEYVGPATCAQCHPSEAAVQENTPMAKACLRAADSKALQENERLSFRLGDYAYDIMRTTGGSRYLVSDGRQSISAPLDWAFGQGQAGQTYILERAGVFYESQLSYFPILQALDFTPGHSHSVPSSLEEAIGRRLDPAATHRCFDCHNTASSTAGQFDPDHLIPGVTCEACHGPGARHVSAMRKVQRGAGPALILNPAKLGPVESLDFCGACHHTWADVVMEEGRGIGTVRFQPYRLELSRCWGKGNTGITCLTCHDPHQPLAGDPASYDDRCLGCHSAAKRSSPVSGRLAASCPQATKNCVTCHMPKYEVPDTHTKFTDHWIRIARSERSYPD
jgi:Cytochrome c554 and c-prime